MSAPRFLLLAALIVAVALALSLQGVDRLWIVLGVIVAWIAASAFEWFSWSQADERRRGSREPADFTFPTFVPPPRPEAPNLAATTILEAPAVEPPHPPPVPRVRPPAPGSALLEQGTDMPRYERAEHEGLFGNAVVDGKKTPDVVRGIFKPRKERHGRAERWLDGAMYLHLEAWIRPGLPNVDPCKLSIDLQRQVGGLHDGPGDRAIGYVEDFVHERRRRKKREWLDRPVLVLVQEAGKNREDVERGEPLAVDIRLAGTDRGEVGAPNAGQAGRPPAAGLESAYELRSLLADGEGDRALLSEGEIAVGRGSSAALDDRPGQVVETGPEVVDDVPQKKAVTPRKRGKRRYGDDEAVTVRLVFDRRGAQRLGIAVHCEGLELSLEYLYVSYRPGPFEPGAVE